MLLIRLIDWMIASVTEEERQRRTTQKKPRRENGKEFAFLYIFFIKLVCCLHLLCDHVSANSQDASPLPALCLDLHECLPFGDSVSPISAPRCCTDRDCAQT